MSLSISRKPFASLATTMACHCEPRQGRSNPLQEVGAQSHCASTRHDSHYMLMTTEINLPQAALK